MQIYEELKARGLIAQGTNEEEISKMVNEGKAVLLREYTGKLTPERAEQILSGEFSRKPKKSTAAAFKVKPAIYKKYFTASISQKEFDSIVDEALALYFAQKEAAAV